MAAAIRHAARRIGGGALQRTTTRLASTKVGLTADQKVDATIRLVLIDKKTEELYDLIAGFKSKYALKGSLGQNQSSLLNQLSVQIQPRRHDPRWRSCRRSALVDDCVKHAGALFIGCVAGDASFHWYQERGTRKMVKM